MKKIIFMLPAFILPSCSYFNAYPNKDACVLVYNLETKKFIETKGQSRCEQRVIAGSLFKIPLSLMAYDSGLLQDETRPVFKWKKDSPPFEITQWNTDQNPTDWMRNSTVWVSQELTTKLGAEKLQSYLEKFNFGNKDFSGGLRAAWLPFGKILKKEGDGTLKISGYEQVQFMEKFWRGELDVKSSAIETTKKILDKTISPSGTTLTGKTINGFYDEKTELRLGGFTGLVSKGNSHYIIVVNFNDRTPLKEFRWGGSEAREMAINVLEKLKLW